MGRVDADYNRRRGVAQQRAYRRLALAHPEEFWLLLTEERTVVRLVPTPRPTQTRLSRLR